MLRKSLNMQLKVIFSRKKVIFVFFALFTIVLINYFINIYLHYGKDVTDLYHPMKILTLASDSGDVSFYFMHIYPILVVIPSGFSLMDDKNSKELIYIQSRVGSRSYYLGKMIAVFLVAFFIFTLPFLIEIVLNCIAFPIGATGDPSNMNIYEIPYIEGVKNYFFYSFYIRSPYLYAIIFTIVFGMVSGVLAMFTAAISTITKKYKIYLFLPVYILLYLIGFFGQIFHSIDFSTSYYFYLRIFNNDIKNGFAYLIVIILIGLFSVLLFVYKGRGDCLE